MDDLAEELAKCQQELYSAHATIEELRVREAQRLKRAGDLYLSSAQKLFLDLRDAKQIEVERKRRVGDVEGADKAEAVGIGYDFEGATILSDQKKYAEAEIVLQAVLKRRRELLGDEHTDTRAAHRKLCKALRAQKGKAKLAQAEGLYIREWKPLVVTSGSGGLAWVSENGFELGKVYVQQKMYAEAHLQHKKVWQERSARLGKMSTPTLESAKEVALMLHELHGDEEAVKVLEPILDHDRTLFSQKRLACVVLLAEIWYSLWEESSSIEKEGEENFTKLRDTLQLAYDRKKTAEGSAAAPSAKRLDLLNKLAEVNWTLGNDEEAQGNFEELLAEKAKGGGMVVPTEENVAVRFTQLLLQRGDAATAEKWARFAEERAMAAFPGDRMNGRVLARRVTLALVSFKQAGSPKLKDAVKTYEEAYAHRDAVDAGWKWTVREDLLACAKAWIEVLGKERRPGWKGMVTRLKGEVVRLEEKEEGG